MKNIIVTFPSLKKEKELNLVNNRDPFSQAINAIYKFLADIEFDSTFPKSKIIVK